MYPLTPYPLTPLGSFIGFFLFIAPLISHLNFHSRNTGIWMCALWIASMNMINFVDTIVWHNNVNIIIPVWCDIGKCEESRLWTKRHRSVSEI